ncbi:DinB family protein [Actinomycetospora soli]|uniref:DinB family protein n=1 Tax=Actinomycetospora soli TaxID=2893887 RepID=UPI001E2A2CA6|nr:DinB family protein [Actinomycetospora soli]MCD2185946.1 DinB family protein [Actinomycetospora soli]
MPTTTGELDAVTALIDDHRQRLVASLDGLTEEEVRRRLVPSRTTLLGLVRHLAFVEVVYFHEGITGTPRAGYGLGTTPHASFGLAATDTVASVVARYREIVEGSRRNVVGLSPDDGLDRGRTVRGVHLQVLRELAQHQGHADILREQLLAARDQ